MDWLYSPEIWIALTTLTLLEIVLGIDNIVFISILVSRLPKAQQQRARLIGLSLAMGGRIGLLFLLSWIMRLQETLFTVLAVDISGRDLILIGGGLFLLAKSTMEIHNAVEGSGGDASVVGTATFGSVLLQIAVIDLVFSLDSVITAVGMVDQLSVMVAAIVIAVGVMMLAAGTISRFVDEHPTIKMLALSFLVLIGTALIAEGISLHIPKGYLYFAMAFSLGVEVLNLKVRGSKSPVVLHKKIEPEHTGNQDSA